MKILIIDNDSKVLYGLKAMIEKYCTPITSVSVAATIKSGLEAIKELRPDLIFLDVELDEGTGMDLLTACEQTDFNVVFITAHNKYAVDAFKCSAIDFLLKPVGIQELQNAVKKSQTTLSNRNLLKQLQIMKESLTTISAADKKIVLRDSSSLYFVRVADIIHCKADGSYTEFFLTDNKKLMMSEQLKEYETILEPYGFLRTHHSHLVNMSHVIKFDKSEGGALLLENNHLVPVSQRKKERVIELLSRQ